MYPLLPSDLFERDLENHQTVHMDLPPRSKQSKFEKKKFISFIRKQVFILHNNQFSESKLREEVYCTVKRQFVNGNVLYFSLNSEFVGHRSCHNFI